MHKGGSCIPNIMFGDIFGDNVEIIWTLHLEINNRLRIFIHHSKVKFINSMQKNIIQRKNPEVHWKNNMPWPRMISFLLVKNITQLRCLVALKIQDHKPQIGYSVLSNILLCFPVGQLTHSSQIAHHLSHSFSANSTSYFIEKINSIRISFYFPHLNGISKTASTHLFLLLWKTISKLVCWILYPLILSRTSLCSLNSLFHISPFCSFVLYHYY